MFSSIRHQFVFTACLFVIISAAACSSSNDLQIPESAMAGTDMENDDPESAATGRSSRNGRHNSVITTPTTDIENVNSCDINKDLVNCLENCPSADERPKDKNYEKPSPENKKCCPSEHPPPQCDENTEIAVNCVDDGPSDYCPKSEDNSTNNISMSSNCDKPGCKCRFNYKRLENGTCVPADDCPPFNCSGPNEEYDSCPPYCPGDSCSQASPTGLCHIIGRIGIVVECRPKCRCIKGYWRNDDGNCIPYAKCPGICPDNEEYTNCTQAVCRATNCSEIVDIAGCFNNDESECRGGCVCIENYLRNDDGTCVPKEQCVTNITPQCDDTETAVKCVTYGPSDSCARSNEGDNDYNQVPSDCDNPGCKCGFNYRRSLNGTCIPARDCPPFNCTGPNEEYNPCPPYCPGDGCSQATPTGRCPIFGTIGIVVECRPTCRCIKGYWRNVAGECIPYAECPGICPDNEEYTNCTQAVLRATNCSRRFDIADHFNSDESECQGGCVCKENYLRNENGSCVSAEQCENNNEQKHNNKNIPIERKRAHHKLAFRFYRRHPFLRWINVYPAAVVYTDIDYNQ